MQLSLKGFILLKGSFLNLDSDSEKLGHTRDGKADSYDNDLMII